MEHLLSTEKDESEIYKITRIVCEINTAIDTNTFEEIAEDSESKHRIEIGLLNLSGYIANLSGSLKEEYNADELQILQNLGDAISYGDLDFAGVWEIVTNNHEKFKALIQRIVKIEGYDFSEQERLTTTMNAYDLADTYNADALTAYHEDPLSSLDIPELSPDESKEYGQFKIEIKKYGSDDENEEYSIAEFLYLKENDEWKEIFYGEIRGRKHDYEHGRTSEFRGSPFQRVIYVDVDDLVYYIENDSGILFCSINRTRWYRYNVEPRARPYHGRVDKLRKFKISG